MTKLIIKKDNKQVEMEITKEFVNDPTIIQGFIKQMYEEVNKK